MQYNPQQQLAVNHLEGPLLVLSGAGTGKTRVVVGRIEHMIASGIAPDGILAITFTRKAADEMKQRLLATGTFGVERVTVSTFHALCLKLLKQYASYANLPRDFSILDEGEKSRMLASLLKELDMTLTVSVADMASFISACKNRLQSADDWEKQSLAQGETNQQRQKLIQQKAQAFRLYEGKKKEAAKLDFDDLLVKLYHLLHENTTVRAACQARFTHVLVDEYQDTNVVQYRIAYMLTQHSHNLCVVGDDDQSIYSWRGAEVDNILDFPKIFKGCQIVRLEQNYRSTKGILDAAYAVIHNNEHRMKKKLWTENPQGEKPLCFCEETAVSECHHVTALMEKLHENGMAYGDMAVLYRRNSASAVMEEALSARHIPCALARESGIFDLYEIRSFLARMERNISILQPMREMEKIASDMGYFEKKRELDEAEEDYPPWIEAVSVLFDSAAEYFTVHKHDTLSDFARHIKSIAQNRAEKGANAVNLLTLHGAKGLEFRAVFMIQLSDDVIPGRNIGLMEEEERRLFYVGMTRAKELLFLSHCRYTSRDARHAYTKEESRFLEEIPPILLRDGEEIPRPKKPSKEEPTTPKDTRFQIGERVKHALYGSGVVVEISQRWTKVCFDNGQERKFLRHFLEKNK